MFDFMFSMASVQFAVGLAVGVCLATACLVLEQLVREMRNGGESE